MDLLPNKTKITDAVESLLLREGDHLGLNRAVYLGVAKDVHREMNFGGMKDTERYFIEVNRGSGLPYILLPDNYFEFSTLYVPDAAGVPVPLMQNKNLSEEIIDLSAKKKCSCGCGCSSELCANVKNYEVIKTTVTMPMPDGSTEIFTKTSRKKINPDGSYVLEVTEPVMRYDGSGTHTATVLETTTKFLCKLDVQECGCVDHSEKNLVAVGGCCQFSNVSLDCGRPLEKIECPEDMGYSFSDDKKRIIFSSKFPYNWVILRCYVDLKTKQLTIPIIAKTFFMLKLQFERIKFDLGFNRSQKDAARFQLNQAESDFLTDISRCTLSQTYKVLNPPRIMPK